MGVLIEVVPAPRERQITGALVHGKCDGGCRCCFQQRRHEAAIKATNALYVVAPMKQAGATWFWARPRRLSFSLHVPPPPLRFHPAGKADLGEEGTTDAVHDAAILHHVADSVRCSERFRVR